MVRSSICDSRGAGSGGRGDDCGRSLSEGAAASSALIRSASILYLAILSGVIAGAGAPAPVPAN